VKMAAQDSLAPLREQDYRRLFLANTASTLGDQVVPVVLAFAVLDVTGSPTALGIVLLARTLPLAIFVLTGGVWADRLPRQLIMMASDFVRFGSQSIFSLLLFTGHAALWSMVALQAIHGTSSAFYRPASSGLMAQLLPREQRQRGTALMYSMTSSAYIVGPVLAGVLLAVSQPAWALAADAVSFAVSGLLLSRIHIPDREGVTSSKEQRSFTKDLADGWTEVVSRFWLRSWIFNFAFFQFTVLASFLVLGPVVSRASLGGDTAWAVISACVGVGSLLGSVGAVRLNPARPLVVIGMLLLLAPAVLVGLAVAAPLWVLAAISVLFGGIITFADAVWETVVQNHVPERVLSRVVAYDYLGSSVLRPLGLAIVGPLSVALGVNVVLLTAAVLYLLVTVSLLIARSTWTLTALPTEEEMGADSPWTLTTT
jgi:MFS family permease